jgi:starch-binding outer membrane protein, SusD/RagB family
MMRSNLLLSLSFFALAACENALSVDMPTRVPEEALDGPGQARLLVQSAIADFNCAFSGFVLTSGAVSDELIGSNTGGGVDNLDRLVFNMGGDWATNDCVQYQVAPAASPGLYTPLSTARFTADDAIRRIQAYNEEQVPDRDTLMALANAYAGFAYTLFGEVFCEVTFDGGPINPRDSALIIAERRFTAAIALAQKKSASGILDMALVGRARARLDLGRAAEAATDAKLVSRGFLKNAQYSKSSTRRENAVYVANHRMRTVSVDGRFRGLTVGVVTDTRVSVVNARKFGTDGRTPLWHQAKYNSESSPIQIAGWNEAQLIIAEVEGGQSAVDRINDLRTASQLPPFDSADPIAIRDQVWEERRRELFLDGHRWGDMLRLGIPFDTGVNAKGRPYGPGTCMPLPDVETKRN